MSRPLMAECAKIRNHPENPRRVLRNVDELAASIREHGLIQPVVISPDPQREGHYLLHAGHRRLAAFRKLGLTQIPATLRQVPESRRTEVMLVENLQRDDLTPVEIGRALVKLRGMHSPPLTQADMARRLGKSPGWVGQMLLFAELDEDDSAAMSEGELTWAQATERARQVKAARGGRVLAKVERNDDRPSRGWHFAFNHPLAGDARLLCDLRGHSRGSGRRIGGVACGPDWEAVLRADERGGRAAIDELLAAVEPDVDEVVIDQLMDPHHPNCNGNPAERLEALARLLDKGVAPATACGRVSYYNQWADRALADLQRLTAARRRHGVLQPAAS